MATVKRLRPDAAKRAEELAAEAGVSVAELLSALVFEFGERGRDAAAAKRVAKAKLSEYGGEAGGRAS